MSGRPKWISSSATPRKPRRFSIGSRKCASTNSSASWWMRTWNCFRAKRRKNISASYREAVAAAFGRRDGGDFASTERGGYSLPYHYGRRIRFRHLRARAQTGDESGKRRIDNCNLRTESDDVVEMDDIDGTHPDASVTYRQTDVALLRRAVNVNVATECIGVLRLAAAQPENPRYDRIATG